MKQSSSYFDVLSILILHYNILYYEIENDAHGI